MKKQKVSKKEDYSWMVVSVLMLVALIISILTGGFGTYKKFYTPEKHVFGLEVGDGHVLGDPDAPVIMYEFTDFQCTFCAQYAVETEPELVRDYVDEGKLKIVFKHFANPNHPYSIDAALASECAGEQGRFWDYQHALFEKSYDFVEFTFSGVAESLDLNITQFDECLESEAYMDKVKAQSTSAFEAGFRSTPVFVINGRVIEGAYPYEDFKEAIEEALN